MPWHVKPFDNFSQAANTMVREGGVITPDSDTFAFHQTEIPSLFTDVSRSAAL